MSSPSNDSDNTGSAAALRKHTNEVHQEHVRELAAKGRSRVYRPVTRLSPLLDGEGRRGTSVWQRRRLLSDILPGILKDIRQASKNGLPENSLESIITSIIMADQIVEQLEVDDVRTVLDNVLDHYVGILNHLKAVRGNGPSQIERLALISELAAARKDAAQSARTSRQFSHARISRAAIDSVVKIISEGCKDRDNEWRNLRAAIARYNYRKPDL